MIAMQYSYALPADYDMGIIDRRVSERGRALDAHEPLILKAYGVARRGDAAIRGNENLYAPFYLWKDTDGLTDFLCSAGFAGLVDSFGWPVVRTWPVVLSSEVAPHARLARFSSRQVVPVARFTPLAALRRQEARDARAAAEQGAVIAIAALEPATWSLVRYRAWVERPAQPALDGDIQDYVVQHVSHPAAQRKDLQ
jgi:hypothetical protein